jgi:hypothetical protein
VALFYYPPGQFIIEDDGKWIRTPRRLCYA